ncbi:beta-ketoacyl synthase N-terminal-like domain-containing protein, partial [Bacillus subtilis]|uniref:beta-ketoacyl synthase N-terminal-like domain-containing protein n=1 Tax=Bacillus subtilis TaxID=1423 RepID=UPI002576BA3E
MSGRLPQGDSVHEVWDNVKKGKWCMSEMAGERGEWGRGKRDGEKGVGRWGGFLKEIEGFDGLFFEIWGKEAERM